MLVKYKDNIFKLKNMRFFTYPQEGLSASGPAIVFNFCFKDVYNPYMDQPVNKCFCDTYVEVPSIKTGELIMENLRKARDDGNDFYNLIIPEVPFEEPKWLVCIEEGFDLDEYEWEQTEPHFHLGEKLFEGTMDECLKFKKENFDKYFYFDQKSRYQQHLRIVDDLQYRGFYE